MSKLEVTELTKEIYNRYPNVWEELRNKYNMKSMYKNTNVLFYTYTVDGCVGLLRKGKDIGTAIPFSMLYGLLEDFFEENAININWNMWCSLEYSEPLYNYTIKDIYGKRIIDNSSVYTSKNEAKEQVILKACEILEERLNGGKHEIIH